MADQAPEGAAAPVGVMLGSVAAVAVGLWYVVLMDLGVHWFDSAELAAASYTLGVSHPPGLPIYHSLSRMVTLIPVGDIGFRCTLVSAMSGALAVGLLFVFAHRYGGWMAVPGAALLAGSFTMVSQAIRTEVYALLAALLIAMVALVAAWARSPAGGRPRLAGLLGVVFGLAASLHHVSAVAVALPLLVWCATRGWRDGSAGESLVPGIVGFVVGLATVLYLPARAISGAALNWGDPSTIGRLIGHLAALQYTGVSSGLTADVLFDRLGAFGRSLFADLGWGGLLLVLVGLVAALRNRLATAVAGGVCLLSALLLYNSWISRIGPSGTYTNLDARGYLLSVVALGGALVALGLFGARGALLPEPGEGEGRRSWFRSGLLLLMSLLALAAILPTFRSSHGRAFARGNRAVALWTEALHRSAAQGGLVAATGDMAFFGLLYARLVEHARPDLDVIQLSWLRSPAGRAALRSLPESQRLPVGLLVEGRSWPERRSLLLGTLPSTRPVYVDKVRVLGRGEGVAVVGLLYQVLPGERALKPAGSADPLLSLLEGESRLPYWSRDRSSRTSVGSRVYNRGNFHLRAGALPAAARDFRMAVALWPRLSPGWHNLGLALLAMGRPKSGVEPLRNAVRLAPLNPRPLCDLALALAGSGRRREARRLLIAALRLFPGNPRLVRILGGLGVGGASGRPRPQPSSRPASRLRGAGGSSTR